jgi:hypothetical protein
VHGRLLAGWPELLCSSSSSSYLQIDAGHHSHVHDASSLHAASWQWLLWQMHSRQLQCRYIRFHDYIEVFGTVTYVMSELRELFVDASNEKVAR